MYLFIYPKLLWMGRLDFLSIELIFIIPSKRIAAFFFVCDIFELLTEKLFCVLN